MHCSMAWFNGGLAQLGEHLLCKQGVVGSIPSTSTNYLRNEEVQEPIFKPDGFGIGFC